MIALKKSTVFYTVSFLARLGLAAIWLFAGIPKLLDPELNELAISAYHIVPYWAVTPIAVVQPAVEIVLGMMLLIGLGVRFAAGCSAVLFVLYIAAIAWVWVHGYRIDCGCFTQGGEDLSVTGWTYASDIARDTGFIALAAWLVGAPRSWCAIGPRSRREVSTEDVSESVEAEMKIKNSALESSPAPDEHALHR